MSGLLEVLGSAMAGGGKGLSEGFAEKTKAEAQALRDENIARLEGMRQQLGFEHAEKLQGQSFKHTEAQTDKQIAAQKGEGALNRTHQTTQSVLEAGMKENAANRQAEREDVSKQAQFEREQKAGAVEFDRRLKTSLENVRAEVQEKNKLRSETMKLRDDLIAAGMPNSTVNERILNHIAPDKTLVLRHQEAQLKLEELKNRADTYIKASNLLMKENDTATKPLTAEEIDTKAWEMTKKAFQKPGATPAPSGKSDLQSLLDVVNGKAGTGAGKPSRQAGTAEPASREEPKPAAKRAPVLLDDPALAANAAAADKERGKRQADADEFHGRVGQFLRDRTPRPGLLEIKPRHLSY